jgi:hypothetical protein
MTFKIFVMPDATTEVETVMGTAPTLADTKALISLVASGAMKRYLDSGVADIVCTTALEEADCYAVVFEYIYPECKGHTHESMISGRLVQA